MVIDPWPGPGVPSIHPSLSNPATLGAQLRATKSVPLSWIYKIQKYCRKKNKY